MTTKDSDELDDFDDYMSSNYDDEINDTLHLVEQGYLPPNIFCDKLALNNFKSRFEDIEHPNIPISMLRAHDLDPPHQNTNKIITLNSFESGRQETFEYLDRAYSRAYPDGTIFDDIKVFNRTRNAVTMFTESLLSGCIPPQRIYVSNCLCI